MKALLAGWELSPIGFLILVNVLLLLLGCVLEGTAILLIIVPVFIPTAQALGIDLVHFGVVVVVNIMLGLITPPYGLLLFIMTNIAGEPLRDIVRDVLPFLLAMIVALAIITFVPETVLWLPRLLRLPGMSMLDQRTIHDQADLRPQRPQPQPPRHARAGDLRHDDAGRSRGHVPRGRRRTSPSSSGSRTAKTRSSTGSTRRSTRAAASSSIRPPSPSPRSRSSMR